MALAITVCAMGAGRLTTADVVDHAVGLQLCVSVGDAVQAGQAWMIVHHNAPLSPDHQQTLEQALAVGSTAPAVLPPCVGVIESVAGADAVFRSF